MVSHRAHNPGVVGSNPTLATIMPFSLIGKTPRFDRGMSRFESLKGNHDDRLAKQEKARVCKTLIKGSSPLSISNRSVVYR